MTMKIPRRDKWESSRDNGEAPDGESHTYGLIDS